MLLTICIPTRNKPEALKATLTSLIRQIASLENRDAVEILVSDNTDKNELRIPFEYFNERGIKYRSNHDNIGYAGNINMLIQNANGDYIWLLADDDFVMDTAVPKIVAALAQQAQTINYLTFFSGGDFGSTRDDNMYFKGCQQNYFQTGSEFLYLYWRSIIFVSTNIFHRQKMLDHAKQYQLFLNVNDTYQNSLLCISFVDKFGGVQVIPETLLYDSYQYKVYTPYTSIKVPVLDYVKLLVQLRKIGLESKSLIRIKRAVDFHVLSYGLDFVVRKIETLDNFNYEKELKILCEMPDLFISTKMCVLLIRALLRLNSRISRFLIKVFFWFIGQHGQYDRFSKSAQTFYEKLNKTDLKISY